MNDEAPYAKPGWILPIGSEQTWLSLELIWENPPSTSAPLPFPSRGTAGIFRGAQATSFRRLQMQLSPRHQGKLWDAWGSSFCSLWGPLVGALFGPCQWQAQGSSPGQRGHVAVTALPIPHDEMLHPPRSNPFWRARPVSFTSAPTPLIPPSSSFVFIS